MIPAARTIEPRMISAVRSTISCTFRSQVFHRPGIGPAKRSGRRLYLLGVEVMACRQFLVTKELPAHRGPKQQANRAAKRRFSQGWPVDWTAGNSLFC